MEFLIRMIVSSWFGCSFVLAVVTLSSGQAIVESLVFLYLEYLGSSYTMMGLIVVLTVTFEIPIFHVAPTLLKQFGSGNLLLISSLGYIVRVVGYTLIPKGRVLWVLFLEPLHGITFACTSTASVDFVLTLMPPRYEASGQGLLQLFAGGGSALGLFFGGLTQEHLGPKVMYRIAALFVFFGSSMFWTALHGSADSQSSHMYPLPIEDLEITEFGEIEI